MTETTCVPLRPDEAMELGEMLEFVADWLEAAPPAVAESLSSFGHPSYPLTELRTDLMRFAFLLGVSERFGPEEDRP